MTTWQITTHVRLGCGLWLVLRSRLFCIVLRGFVNLANPICHSNVGWFAHPQHLAFWWLLYVKWVLQAS